MTRHQPKNRSVIAYELPSSVAKSPMQRFLHVWIAAPIDALRGKRFFGAIGKVEGAADSAADVITNTRNYALPIP